MILSTYPKYPYNLQVVILLCEFVDTLNPTYGQRQCLQLSWHDFNQLGSVDRNPLRGRLHLGKLTLILRLLVWPTPFEYGRTLDITTKKSAL